MEKSDSALTGSTFNDHFSGHASSYALYRPVYPEPLFEYLSGISPNNTQAWDCATGSGQAAISLASYFKQVIATDASDKQLAQARQHPKIEYRHATAENSGIESDSIDLICVAQAAHWFNLPSFYQECRRVSKTDTIIAIWCYERFSLSPEFDTLIEHLYNSILSDFWPPERRWVETGYADLPFPFEVIEVPDFAMSAHWSLQRVFGYIESWSAVQRYVRLHGKNPVDEIRSDLHEIWDDEAIEKQLTWPLKLKVGHSTRK